MLNLQMSLMVLQYSNQSLFTRLVISNNVIIWGMMALRIYCHEENLDDTIVSYK